MKYITYIIFSRKINKYYVGSTQDLDDRIARHNTGDGKYTKKGIPWDLIKYYEHNSRSEAVKMENMVKKRGIKRFLESNI